MELLVLFFPQTIPVLVLHMIKVPLKIQDLWSSSDYLKQKINNFLTQPV